MRKRSITATFTCGCCTVAEFPCRKACKEHSVICNKAEDLSNVLDELPGRVDNDNIDDIVERFENMTKDMKEIRAYLKMHRDENFVITYNEDERDHTGK